MNVYLWGSSHFFRIFGFILICLTSIYVGKRLGLLSENFPNFNRKRNKK
jgi:hypothetical protein